MTMIIQREREKEFTLEYILNKDYILFNTERVCITDSAYNSSLFIHRLQKIKFTKTTKCNQTLKKCPKFV